MKDFNFVLGCPRSGTTFLMDCLDALPYSECVTGHLIPIYVPHLFAATADEQVKKTILSTLEFSFLEYLDTYGQAKVPQIRRWFRKSLDSHELKLTLQNQRLIERMVYKEPFLAFAPEMIYEGFPEAKIVHIYRDGRDAADSLERKYKVLTDQKLKKLQSAEVIIGRSHGEFYIPWWVEYGQEDEFLSLSPYLRSVWMWKEMLLRCHQYFNQPEVIASGRVLSLRYEDLVKDPVYFGNLVVEHFGCQMNHRLKKRFLEARDSSIGIHKRRTSEEIDKATHIAEPILKLYGY